jgi:hypothetical protein
MIRIDHSLYARARGRIGLTCASSCASFAGMTSTTETWDIFGKTPHGEKYAVAEGLPVSIALRMVNILNKGRNDGFFHHFYTSATDVANALPSLLPGERFGTARSFVAWLVQIGVVDAKAGGRYQIGEEVVRGQVRVAERFGSVDSDGNWVVSRLTYKAVQ